MDDKLIAQGVIKTEKNDKKRNVRAADQQVEQIQALIGELRKLVEEHRPRLLVAELPTCGGKSSRAVASMAIAQAAVAATAEYGSLPTEWVTPRENKVGLTGHANASKDDMMRAAAKIWPADEFKHVKGARKGKMRNEYEHVADAVGVFEFVKGRSSMVKFMRGDK